MDFRDMISEFSVSVYGKLETYNQTLSKARLRTFYKYFNRNGTYITDEFAEKLISSAPYTPVKGIYDKYDGDYEDHGKKRDEGRIYGIVPENPNFAWEDHKDEDGIIRTYACFDVLLFTALYHEANEIMGKAQSMELYQPSLKGEFKYIDGRKAFVFSEGCFLGLQVLGENVEPCFEGAAFYTFYDTLKQAVEKIEKYNLNSQIDVGGQENMQINFKLSDSTKFDMLFNLLNTNFNEAGNWTIDYCICDVYDKYALAYNYELCAYERIYYTKDDANDSLSITNKEKCYVEDISETEKTALNTIRALNGDTYEKIDENFTANSEVETKISEYEQKIEERDASISTLTSERDTAQIDYANAQAQVETLTSEIETLNQYKAQVETDEKNEVFAKYEAQLDEEVIKTYKEKISEYTAVQLDKELAFELVCANPTIFTNAGSTQSRIPKNNTLTGVDAILANYVK